MSDQTYEIGLKMWDGYLSFDPDATPELDPDLNSWIENMSPEDLISGLMRFKVTVRITEWDVEGCPTLELVSP